MYIVFLFLLFKLLLLFFGLYGEFIFCFDVFGIRWLFNFSFWIDDVLKDLGGGFIIVDVCCFLWILLFWFVWFEISLVFLFFLEVVFCGFLFEIELFLRIFLFIFFLGFCLFLFRVFKVVDVLVLIEFFFCCCFWWNFFSCVLFKNINVYRFMYNYFVSG